MRKLRPDQDNHVDNIILDISEYICPWFKSMGFTANGITTLSLISGLIAVYFLYTGKVYLFAIAYFISYFMDCLDGHYARKYDMVTTFGDYYDHVKDITVVVCLIAVLIYINKDCKSNIVIILCSMVVLFILQSIHFGCQERIYDKNESPSLSLLKRLCPGDPTKTIRVTRFVGCGTGMVIFILLIIYTEITKTCKL